MEFGFAPVPWPVVREDGAFGMVCMCVTTVDGRNPASVDMVNIPPLFTRFYSSKTTVLHFLIHRSGSDGIHRLKRRKRRFDNGLKTRAKAEAQRKEEAEKVFTNKTVKKHSNGTNLLKLDHIQYFLALREFMICFETSSG